MCQTVELISELLFFISISASSVTALKYMVSISDGWTWVTRKLRSSPSCEKNVKAATCGSSNVLLRAWSRLGDDGWSRFIARFLSEWTVSWRSLQEVTIHQEHCMDIHYNGLPRNKVRFTCLLYRCPWLLQGAQKGHPFPALPLNRRSNRMHVRSSAWHARFDKQLWIWTMFFWRS